MSVGRSLLLDLAEVEQQDLVRHRHRLGLVVRHDERRESEPHDQLAQPRARFLAQLGVEVGQRLVHQHDRRVVNQRACDRDALLLSAGELMRQALRQRAQAEIGQRLIDALIDLAARESRAGAARRRRSRRPCDAATARTTGTPARDCASRPACRCRRRCRRARYRRSRCCPRLGCSSPATERSSVVLPLPDAPSSATTSPGWSVIETPFRIGLSPYLQVQVRRRRACPAVPAMPVDLFMEAHSEAQRDGETDARPARC